MFAPNATFKDARDKAFELNADLELYRHFDDSHTRFHGDFLDNIDHHDFVIKDDTPCELYVLTPEEYADTLLANSDIGLENLDDPVYIVAVFSSHAFGLM